MVEIVLEIVSLATLVILIVSVVFTGSRRNVTNDGWNWILVSLGLFFLGQLIDLTDNFPSLNYLVIMGDTEAQALMRQFLGQTLAYIFLCVGIVRWLPTLSSVDRVVKAFNQVTESEEALAKAHRSLDHKHQELQSILRNTPDVIFRVDPTGRITFISGAIWNYGYDPETLIGSDLVRLIHPEDQDGLVVDFGTPLDGYELEARQYTVRVVVRKRPDESEEESKGMSLTRTFQISIDDIAIGEGVPEDWGIRQGIARDISDLHEMQDKVHTLQAMVPICSCCKSVRNDEGYWERVEEYIMKEVETPLSHSICPECLKAQYGDIASRKEKTG